MHKHKQCRPAIYESGLKIAVAREYLTGNLGYKLLGKKYGIENYHTIRHFVRWYKKHYPDGEHEALLAADEGSFKDDKQLARQLKEANLKIAGLEMLIETARKELGIDIVKKPGTKQSLK